MISEHFDHLVLAKRSLGQFSKRINSAKDQKSRESVVTEFKKFMDYPFFLQFVEYLHKKAEKKRLSQECCKKKILQEYGLLERVIRSKSDDPEILFCIDDSKERGAQEKGFPSWRRAGLLVALRLYFEKNRIGLLSILGGKDELEEKAIEKILNFPSVVKWKEEKRDLLTIFAVLEGVSRIEGFNGNILDDERWDCLVQDLKTILYSFEEGLFVVDTLATLEIEKITCTYIPGTSKTPKSRKKQAMSKSETLWFCIGKKKIKFTGLIATTIKLAIETRFEGGVEFDDIPLKKDEKGKKGGKCDKPIISADVKAYQSIYRRMEDINDRLFKEYKEYGLIDFVLHDGYTLMVNPLYLGLIEFLH